MKKHEGIRVRHSRACPTDKDATAKCRCSPAYEAGVWLARDGKQLRKTFRTLAEARAWRQDAGRAIRRGEMRRPTRVTVQEAAEAWLEGARTGAVLNRSQEPFKPSVLRGYDQALRDYILPALGRRRLSEVTRRDVQFLADDLRGGGLGASSVRNALLPLRGVYRKALEDGDVLVNPTAGVRLPPVNGRRDVDVAREDVEALLVALPKDDRALWATAFYAGLRRGELRALRWRDVDLASGAIQVRRGWDDKEGEVAPKTRKGERTVPLTPTLRDYLVEHKLRSGRGSGDLVFGSGPRQPFTPSYVAKRARKAWDAEDARRQEKGIPALRRVTLHGARHAYVSLMHDAGISLERIGDYVGHSTTYMTDRYRHLVRDHLADAARRFNDYLARGGGKAEADAALAPETNAGTNAQAPEPAR